MVLISDEHLDHNCEREERIHRISDLAVQVLAQYELSLPAPSAESLKETQTAANCAGENPPAPVGRCSMNIYTSVETGCETGARRYKALPAHRRDGVATSSFVEL